jgi:serine/threonine protein kinase/Tol biopolymer transport system component
MAEHPAAPFRAGRQIGVYVLQEPLGSGGMGVVYRATDTRLNRSVAIKVLPDDLATPSARRRFQREAQTASSLNHPHIVTVLDAGEIDGRDYLVTELIDGGTLRSWSQTAARGWRESIDLLVGVADALATAHEAGILHRDIKPENILVMRSGYAKLADFGLAKLFDVPTEGVTRAVTDARTRHGAILGTVAYMSPEQASGRPLDARSDVFSFGVVLYEVLAGRKPFGGASDLDMMHATVHTAAAPLPADIPLQLRVVVDRALEKDPADRYQSMRDMVVDLRRVSRQSTEMPTVPVPLPASRRSRYWPIGIAALLLLTGVAGALFLWQSRTPAEPAARGTYTQLTNFDFATYPALSPDGRLLAFVHGPESQIPFTFAPAEIYVKALPDGDPVQLTRDGVPNKFAPRFSPDGLRVAYSTLDKSGFTAWVVPVLGGQEPRRLLANAEGVNWIKPGSTGRTGTTGSSLLFSTLTGEGITMAIATASESRSGERVVFKDGGIMDHFSYLSPDGRSLLLAEMGFNGWQPCRVAPFDGSSKGRKVGPQGAQCTGAAWSPDGAWMYFTADTGAGFHIWRQRFPDGTPEQVTFGAAEEEGIDFAPDGKSFVTSIGTRQSTLWIHDARGHRQAASDSHTAHAKFSADGRRLYYLVRTVLGTPVPAGDLWVVDLESGQRQRLLSEFQIEHYDLASDGERIVFVPAPRRADTADARSGRGSDGGRQGVWLATLNGSAAPRQLTAAKALQAFFGTGRDLFFAAQDSDGTFVYRVRDDGSGLRKAIPEPVYFLYGVSPDGQHVAVWATGGTGDAINSVIVRPVDGGSPMVVCRNNCAYRSDASLPSPQEVSWSPDGRFLYLALMGSTYAIPVARGNVVPPALGEGIRSVQEAAALPGVRPFAVPGAIPGPDPSIYAYPKVNAQRNIYRVPVP